VVSWEDKPLMLCSLAGVVCVFKLVPRARRAHPKFQEIRFWKRFTLLLDFTKEPVCYPTLHFGSILRVSPKALRPTNGVVRTILIAVLQKC